MAKSKLTKRQIEYNKAVKNLKQRIRRAEKSGYMGININIPEMPKRVTQKSIERLTQIRGQELYQKAQYFITDFRTGETILPSEVPVYKAQQRAEHRIIRKRADKYQLFVNMVDTFINGLVGKDEVESAKQEYLSLLPSDEIKPAEQEMNAFIQEKQEERRREEEQNRKRKEQKRKEREKKKRKKRKLIDIGYVNIYMKAYETLISYGELPFNVNYWRDVIIPAVKDSGLTKEDIGQAFISVMENYGGGDMVRMIAYNVAIAQDWLQDFIREAEEIKGENLFTEEQEEEIMKAFYEADEADEGADYDI